MIRDRPITSDRLFGSVKDCNAKGQALPEMREGSGGHFGDPAFVCTET